MVLGATEGKSWLNVQTKSPESFGNQDFSSGAPWGIRTLDLLIRSGLKT